MIDSSIPWSISGQGVQDALLKIVEGSLVTVKPTASRSGGGGRGAAALGGQDSVTIDTTDILFIASGAFSNLYKTIGKRLDRKVISLLWYTIIFLPDDRIW